MPGGKAHANPRRNITPNRACQAFQWNGIPEASRSLNCLARAKNSCGVCGSGNGDAAVCTGGRFVAGAAAGGLAAGCVCAAAYTREKPKHINTKHNNFCQFIFNVFPASIASYVATMPSPTSAGLQTNRQLLRPTQARMQPILPPTSATAGTPRTRRLTPRVCTQRCTYVIQLGIREAELHSGRTLVKQNSA